MQEAEIITAAIADFRRRHLDELATGPAAATPPGWFDQARAVQMFGAHADMLAAAWQSDQERHGQADFWEVDPGGDCEDRALWAHHRLADLGWPKAAMRIWLCLASREGAPQGDKWRGHAVLGIRLTLAGGGTVVACLDPLKSRPMRLEDLGYRFWRMVQ